MPLTRKQRSTEKIRVTLDLSSQFHDRLEKLQSLVDANTKADLIRQALQLYEYIAQATASGSKFREIGPHGEEKEILFFGLPTAT